MPTIKENSNIEILKISDRNSEEWFQFVNRQEQRIQTRLNKYNNFETIRIQLAELDMLSADQEYKIKVIRKLLTQTLDRIKNGKYGKCITCCKDIPTNRLILIPGVSRCINCENNFFTEKK
jgi:RNA polymerase-binding transcription factor DksA